MVFMNLNLNVFQLVDTSLWKGFYDTPTPVATQHVMFIQLSNQRGRLHFEVRSGAEVVAV